jgi:uncharacterized membrane protein HdeD (DUF308 family)
MNTIDELKEVGYLVKIANFIRVNGFKNWKTTLMGCVSGIIAYLATVNWNNPAALKTAIFPITLIVWGVIQKDGSVTGNTVESK